MEIHDSVHSERPNELTLHIDYSNNIFQVQIQVLFKLHKRAKYALALVQGGHTEPCIMGLQNPPNRGIKQIHEYIVILLNKPSSLPSNKFANFS